MARRGAGGAAGTLEAQLGAGLSRLGLDGALATPLLRYLAELAKWNVAYNLTAVREPVDMVSRHLLDSLALLPVLDGLRAQASPPLRILDVGSGAGLPGIPLALARPQWRIVLLDSNGKKARFLRHALRALKIDNAEVIEARVEQWQAPGFDAILSRAFASLADFISASRHLLAPGGQWLAMKGKLIETELAAIPPGVEIREIRRLNVPGLDEERHLLVSSPLTPHSSLP